MSDDLYRLFAIGIQGFRRQAEATLIALGGALGVAADPYPHQLATVARILTDSRIRHLIADEVGLGKTVQALMILNALRIQNPKHRAVVLVPDRLISQWQGECWTRCHTQAVVVGEKDVEDENGFVRIVRPQSVQSGDFRLDPAMFNLLIVDEPQTLPNDVMEVVEREAPAFRQILLLSATPGFGDVTRRHQLLHILEPERALLADLRNEDLDAAFAQIEASALAASGGSCDDPDVAAFLFRTWSTERRIARSRRSEWGRYLPSRDYDKAVVEPLLGEAGRVRLGMEWLAGGSGGTDRWRFMQTLHRSHQSARRAIAARVRRSEADGTLAQAAEMSAASPGDSRFDALLDILGETWSGSPEARVVVVAGDNPTIEFLADRLPRFVGRDNDVAQLRRPAEALGDEAADIRAMHEQLEAFASGKARVLLIGEWIQAGLNLQYFSDTLVFYCTPWEPQTVDQLIGRLDRLSPQGLFRGDRGKPMRTVDIRTIVQRDTVEARIVEGLEGLGVFRRPLPAIGSAEALEMQGALEELAFGSKRGEALDRLAALAERWDEGWERSALSHLSPYSAAAAQTAYEVWEKLPLPEPVLGRDASPNRPTYVRCEDALRGWTEAISKCHFFHVAKKQDLRRPELSFSTIWYAESPEAAPIRLSYLQGRRAMDGHVPFLYRRRDIPSPPVNYVYTDEGEKGGRLLRFLDHGDALHEALAEESRRALYSKLGTSGDISSVVVQFQDGHPALALQGQQVLVSATWADPLRFAVPEFAPGHTTAIWKEAPTEAQKAALSADLESLRDAWQADKRWLAEMIPPLLLIDAAVLSGQEWRPVDTALGLSLLKPLYYGEETVAARSRQAMSAVSQAVARKGFQGQVKRMMAELRRCWDGPLLRLDREISMRSDQVKVEYMDLIALRETEAVRRKDKNFGGQENLRKGQIAAAERSIQMAQAMLDARLHWLESAKSGLMQVKLSRVASLIMRPAPISAM